MTDEREPEWQYVIDDRRTYDARHEVVEVAAVINGQRERTAPGRGARKTVWTYLKCDCEHSQTQLDSTRICQRCGGAL